MKILIACEFSGIVRDAFRAKGHDAWSCDIIPTERRGPHIVNDVRNILDDGWDMMIAHPPCTHLSYAGVRWFKSDPDRWRRARIDFDFFMLMINAPIPLIAVENPKGYTWKWYRRPDQIVHPYQLGDGVTKATCLWLKGLPRLLHANVHPAPDVNWTKYHGSHNGHARSRTFPGVAAQMAEQWGGETRREAVAVPVLLL